MNNSDERDYAEEQYNERLLHDYAEIGHEYAMSGRSRRMANHWAKAHCTVAQERDFWRGFQNGERQREANH